jgi:WD40 repeat protein
MTASASVQRRFLIAVGVSSYQDDRIADLLGADCDAERVRGLLEPMGYEVVLPGLAGLSAREIPVAVERWAVAQQLRAQDVVVVYFAGHGVVGADRHYLQVADTEADLLSTALASEDLARPLMHTEVGHLLVVLDTCYAGAGAEEVAHLAGGLVRSQPRSAGRWILAAARAKETAQDNAFVDALADTLSHPQAGARQEFLSVRDVTTRINTYLKKQERHQHASHSVVDSDGQVPFFKNLQHIPGLPAGELDVETLTSLRKHNDRHFMPRARGVDHAGDRGDYFTARTTALRELATWLRAERHDRRARVITGRPGSGKSALLGRLLMLADPDEPSRTHADPDTLPPPAVEIVPLHARRATRDSLTRDLASALGAPEAGLDELLQIAAQRPTPLVVVVDALDEAGTAGDPTEGARIGRELLRPMTSMVSVRLIIGTRDPLIGTLGCAVTVINLDDPDYVGINDVADYARDVLLDGHDPDSLSPYRSDPAAATHIGRAIAARAGTSFLVARMTARALVHGQIRVDTTTPGWRDTLPSDATEAIAAYLERFDHNRDRVQRLLRPLAYAQGNGLPWSTLWGPIAQALSGIPCPYDDLRWLLDKAGAYLVENTAHHDSVFRLFHETMAEHLRTPGHDTYAHHTITTTLLDQVPTDPITGHRDWANAHPYILDHLATHAAGGRQIDSLLTDVDFLVCANPDTLLAALRFAETKAGRHIETVYRASASLHRLLDPSRRRQVLALDAARHRFTDLQKSLSDKLEWQPRWITGQRTSKSLKTILIGHQDQVNAVACTEVEGNPVALSGGFDNSVRMWDLRTGSTLAVLTGHYGAVREIVCTDVGGRPFAVTRGGDDDVRVWDLSARALHVVLTGHTGRLSQVCCTVVAGKPVVVGACADGYVYVWDPGTGRLRSTLTGHTDPVVGIDCGAIDSTPVAVSVAGDKTAKVWDLESGKLLRTFNRHSDEVLHVLCATLDGELIAVTVSKDNVMLAWEVRRGKLLGTLDGHTDKIDSLAKTVIGGRLVIVTTSHDQTARVWDASTWQERSVLSGHASLVLGVICVDVAGVSAIVTTSSDETVRVWDVKTGELQATLNGHRNEVTALACSVLDGRPLVVTCAIGDQDVRVWDIAESVDWNHTSGHFSSINSVVCAAVDGEPVVVTCSHDGTARVWNLCTGELRTTLSGHGGNIFTVACTEMGGRTVAVTAGWDQVAKVWDLRTGSCLFTLSGHTALVHDVALGELGDLPIAVTASWDHTLKVWDLRSGKLRSTLRGHRKDVNAVVCAEVGGKPIIISGSSDGSARVWDLETGGVQAHFTGHTDSVRVVSTCLVDGEVVVLTGSIDRTVRVWNPMNGNLIASLDGHRSHIEGIAGTVVDGQPVVVTACDDGMARVWGLNTGALLTVLPGQHDESLHGVACAVIDGRPVAITSGVDSSLDSTVRMWDLTTGSCLTVFDLGEWIGGAICFGQDGEVVVGANRDVVVFERRARE